MRIGLVLLLSLLTSIIFAEAIPGRLLVDLKAGISINELTSQITQEKNLEIRSLKQISRSWNIWLVEVERGKEGKVIEALAGFPEVQAVQPDHRISLRNTIPNDTLYSQQWNMKNTGQGNGTVGADIDAEQAWDLVQDGLTAFGDTIVIAIIDGGIDLDHIDLNLWKNQGEIPSNGIDDDNNGYLDDYDGWNGSSSNGFISVDGHGTHVAGIAGATGNNLAGVAGVIWGAKILPIQVNQYTEAEVVEAYSYIFDQRKLYESSFGSNGAFIVATNASFGIDFGQPVDYPIWCGIYDSLGAIGILNTGATINSRQDIDDVGDIPTACPSDYLISVTSSTSQDGLSNSGFGLESIDLGAPGTAVFSTRPNDVYGFSSGTSMATPHVTGAIALLMSAACPDLFQVYIDHPDSITRVMKQAILNGVEKRPNFIGRTVSEGRLNIYNSVRLLLNEYCITCLELDVNVQDVNCAGEGDGSATVSISTGVAPYSFQWSTGDTLATAENLNGGSLLLTVVDSTGCERFTFVEVGEPSELAVATTVMGSSDEGSNGNILMAITGGVSPYTVTWADNSSAGQNRSELTVGQYPFEVTDANGCAVLDTATVLPTSASELLSEKNWKVYPNPFSELLLVEFSDIDEDAIVTILDINGQLVNSQLAKRQMEFNLSAISSGIYFIRVSSVKGTFTQKVVKY